jgi:toxin-antitoxin system PIN domain toxin
MIAVDTNILVFAHLPSTPHHAAALAALTALAEGSAPWALPWPCIHEFIGVVTRPGLYKPPTKLDAAIASVESLLASPTLHLLAETPGYFQKLIRICRDAQVVGARIHDARIAALCLHHGVSELLTADRDFSLFPALRVRNPLQ